MIVVALSHVESAVTWAEMCGFNFPLIVDTDKTVFRYFGLRRSVLAVWNIPSLIKYAEQLTAGTELLRPLAGDDIHQLGGDFMVDTRGQLLYIYRGKTSYDRPSVSQLLAKLHELKQSA